MIKVYRNKKQRMDDICGLDIYIPDHVFVLILDYCNLDTLRKLSCLSKAKMGMLTLSCLANKYKKAYVKSHKFIHFFIPVKGRLNEIYTSRRKRVESAVTEKEEILQSLSYFCCHHELCLDKADRTPLYEWKASMLAYHNTVVNYTAGYCDFNIPFKQQFKYFGPYNKNVDSSIKKMINEETVIRNKTNEVFSYIADNHKAFRLLGIEFNAYWFNRKLVNEASLELPCYFCARETLLSDNYPVLLTLLTADGIEHSLEDPVVFEEDDGFANGVIDPDNENIIYGAANMYCPPIFRILRRNKHRRCPLGPGVASGILIDNQVINHVIVCSACMCYTPSLGNTMSLWETLIDRGYGVDTSLDILVRFIQLDHDIGEVDTRSNNLLFHIRKNFESIVLSTEH